MLLPASGVGVNSAMDDMNLIQQAQRHHLVVRENGEEIDLEISAGDDNPSFGNTTLIGAPPRESSAEEHGETKQSMGKVSQLPNDDQDMSKTQPVKRKKKVVKVWREEWADTYKWAYVDVKDGTARIFCSVCREYGRKHRRNPYGNEGSRNMQMRALEERGEGACTSCTNGCKEEASIFGAENIFQILPDICGKAKSESRLPKLQPNLQDQDPTQIAKIFFRLFFGNKQETVCVEILCNLWQSSSSKMCKPKQLSNY